MYLRLNNLGDKAHTCLEKEAIPNNFPKTYEQHAVIPAVPHTYEHLGLPIASIIGVLEKRLLILIHCKVHGWITSNKRQISKRKKHTKLA
jgi:hypothetical protein